MSNRLNQDREADPIESVDLSITPGLQQLLDVIKWAKSEIEKDAGKWIGISESRAGSGLVKPFEPNYPLPAKYLKQLKP